MTREERYFIQILSDHLGGRQTTPCTDINWNTILCFSRMHQVDGIIYYQCKNFLPDSVRHDYEKAIGATFFLYTNRQLSAKRIEAALKGSGITFFSVKGFAVADYYPIPALRTMGDCDYIIPTSEVESADKALENAGFKRVNEYMQHEWTYEERGLLYELHDVLIRQDEYTSSYQESFFNNFDRYLIDGHLDWSFHFIYLLMHLRKHLIKNGIGIRQFMDLAVIINSIIELNWDWINEKCTELHLNNFANACYDLLSFWFGVKVKGAHFNNDDDFREKMTRRILTNGVFGFADQSNNDNIAKNSIVMGRMPRWINRTKALLKSVFLPYRYMKNYPGCKYVNNKKYLMPVAWMHRMAILMMRRDKSNSIQTLQKYFIEKDELDEREEFLTKMGLKKK